MTNEQEREAWLAEHERLVTLYARACFLSRSHKEMDVARDSLLAHARTVTVGKANLTAYAAELRREVERLCSELRASRAHPSNTTPVDRFGELFALAAAGAASSQGLSDEQVDALVKQAPLEGYALLACMKDDLTAGEAVRTIRAFARALLANHSRVQEVPALRRYLLIDGKMEQHADGNWVEWVQVHTSGVAPIEAPSYTYASTQATNCARCGQHKHTPLRVDRMDGYVCLTCIDEELGRLLDEEVARAAGVALPRADQQEKRDA